LGSGASAAEAEAAGSGFADSTGLGGGWSFDSSHAATESAAMLNAVNQRTRVPTDMVPRFRTRI
jgi:hypothetical protein